MYMKCTMFMTHLPHDGEHCGEGSKKGHYRKKVPGTLIRPNMHITPHEPRRPHVPHLSWHSLENNSRAFSYLRWTRHARLRSRSGASELSESRSRKGGVESFAGGPELHGQRRPRQSGIVVMDAVIIEMEIEDAYRS